MDRVGEGDGVKSGDTDGAGNEGGCRDVEANVAAIGTGGCASGDGVVIYRLGTLAGLALYGLRMMAGLVEGGCGDGSSR